MPQLLDIDVEVLKGNNSYWTAKEISQQPEVWQQAVANIQQRQAEIDDFLNGPLSRSNLKIILAGAGTSAFIGEAIAPYLNKVMTSPVVAVSTTDMLASPDLHLDKSTPTLLISFARSGDSPESIAAINLVDQLVDAAYHLILTCNPEGAVSATYAAEAKGHSVLCLLMPEGSNDVSFAMTSSYSSMMVSCLAVLGVDTQPINTIATTVERVLQQAPAKLRSLAELPFKRLVVLGAGTLSGIAKEAALKMLELSAGQVTVLHDTPLGFRHGPKSVVDAETLIVHMGSNNPYTKLYDSDLLAELQRDEMAISILNLSAAELFPGDEALASVDDVWLGLVLVVYCQILAFHKALVLNVSADNPCPTGEVNRVVKGVVVHPYTS